MSIVNDILADIRERGKGRTRYEGQPPREDEILAAEIERLRALLEECADAIDDELGGHLTLSRRIRAAIARTEGKAP